MPTHPERVRRHCQLERNPTRKRLHSKIETPDFRAFSRGARCPEKGKSSKLTMPDGQCGVCFFLWRVRPTARPGFVVV
jgi:hypothetical protein